MPRSVSGRHRAPSATACPCGSPHCRRHRRGLRGLAAALPLLLCAAGIIATTLTGGALRAGVEARPTPPGTTTPGAVPGPTGVADPGASPTAVPSVPAISGSPSQGFVLPSVPGSTTSPMSIPARVRQQEIAAEAVAERLEEARVDLQAMTHAQTTASTRLDQATRDLTTAQTTFDTWTRNSYMAAARGSADLAPDPRDRMFGHAAPAAGAPLGTLRAAQTRQQQTTDELTRATAATTRVQQSLTDLTADLDRRGKELQTLRTAHQPALAAARKQQEAADATSAARYLRDADGHAATAAVKAVEFALTQRGKPYEWGAEGPDRYDCSGLVQTAYAKAGIQLPRTARPQYRTTPAVPVSALLPGDLLFFATDKTNWDTIHHVAIYLGQGRMLHAPTTGDVVRIAPVWWAEFFAATRVVPANSPSTPKPTKRPSLKPTPVRTPRPTGTPKPSPTTSPTRSPAAPATTAPPQVPPPTNPAPTTPIPVPPPPTPSSAPATEQPPAPSPTPPATPSTAPPPANPGASPT